ncbi:AbgT transporter [Bacteroidales bacterium SW299]|nr:AbgT transporter [Bacteroidales bacterium SW299]
MNRKSLLHPATCFFLLTVLAAFMSWVGTVYEWEGVKSLFSGEGLRWMLHSAGKLYVCSEVVPVVLVLFLGCGLFFHSGLWKICLKFFRHKASVSHKERHALFVSVSFFLVYFCALAVLAWGPWNLVRSVSGTLSGSSFEEGIWCLISLGIGLASVVYGFSSDTYVSDRDIVRGMAFLFAQKASYFVTLYFVLLFFACLDYSGMARAAGVSDDVTEGLCWIVCILLLGRSG